MDKVLFSSNREDWETPQSADENNHKCSKYYTAKEDGLKQDWSGEIVYCNPPYGKRIYKWVEKCYLESRKEGTIVVLLIPSRTDTKYFHDFLYKKCGVELRFIKGRLKFVGAKYPAPFPSLIAVMTANKSEINDGI